MRERELYKLYEREVWAMNIIMALTNEPIVSGNNENYSAFTFPLFKWFGNQHHLGSLKMVQIYSNVY